MPNAIIAGRLKFSFLKCFIGFLITLAGGRSDVSGVPSPKRQNPLLEHAQKPNSRTSSYQ
jgi:hypothetical protein